MEVYILFIRGLNVGSSTRISMRDLVELCSDQRLVNIRTYLNSGNVILESLLSEGEIIAIIEARLQEKLGKEIKVVIRNKRELYEIINQNPFLGVNGSKVGVFLVKTPVSKDILKEIIIQGREEVATGGREIFIYFPDGMGRSKLKFPSVVSSGTMRNMNTIKKLAEITGR